MKTISCTSEELSKPVKIVEGIVEKRQTLPILSNILVVQQGTKVAFSTTDLDIQIRTEAPLGVAETSECKFTVNANKITSILGASNAKDPITIDVTDGKLTLLSRGRKSELQTLPAADYPVIREGTWERSIVLPAQQLRYLLSMTAFAMANQDVRFYLNGVLFVMEGKVVRTVATDTHRLACSEVEIDTENENFQCIIPRKTVRELTRILPDDDTAVKIEFTDLQIKFSWENISFMSKLIEGKFPEYKRVLPSTDTNPKSVLINREDLSNALRFVGIMTNEKFHGIRWILNKDTLEIRSVKTSEHEEAVETLSVQWPYDSMEMGFNITYLAEVLSILKNKEVKFNFSGTAGSVLITMPESPDRFRYVVMPMRI